ncbi:MAG: DUF3990 domain-containing protein [Lachnospiraceae bacterium]|nr:DUF3990 domain-containing protein [Lachnospiraceae bacterium]
MKLYHTAFLEIKEPDLTHGRKNADFGQGFYLTPDEAFATRWAKAKKDAQTFVNSYELDTEGLSIKEWTARNEEWFSYLFGNRRLEPDPFKDYDVIIGPIANDTIYDVLGLTTSGFLSKEESLSLLLVGPCYKQVTIKSEKARKHLHFLSSRIMTPEELKEYGDLLKQEQNDYQALFAQAMKKLEDD